MKTIESYIIEKLHLKSNGNLSHIDDPSDFIESFEREEDKITICWLIDTAIKDQKNRVDNGDINHLCYIIQAGLDKDGNKIYKWSSNERNETLRVGGFTPKFSRVVYVVTSQTILPEKYQKYVKKYKV